MVFLASPASSSALMVAWHKSSRWHTDSCASSVPFGFGTDDVNARGKLVDAGPASSPDLLGPLGQIEQQEFCRIGGADLETCFFTHSSPVAGRQLHVVEPYLSTNDLHPGMAVVVQVMNEFLPCA